MPGSWWHIWCVCGTLSIQPLLLFCRNILSGFLPFRICWTECKIQRIWWKDKIYLCNGAFVYEQVCVGIVGRKAHNTTKVFKNYEPEPAVLSSPQFLRCDKLESQKPLSDCTLDMTQWVYFWKLKNNLCVTEGKKYNWCCFTERNPTAAPLFYFFFIFFFPWKLQNLLHCLCAERKWW